MMNTNSGRAKDSEAGTSMNDTQTMAGKNNPDASIAKFEQPTEDLAAWFKVLGSFLVFFNIWGFPISYGAYQIFYELHYLPSSSASDISWIGTLQGSLLILIGVFGGPLYDLGYYRELLIAGGFLTVFGLMMLSLCTQYWQIILSQGLCVGIGCGLLYVPSLALIGAAFSKRRAVAMGVVTSGIAMGGVVYTIMFQQLLPSVGFPWTTRIMAFLALFTFILAVPLLLWSPVDNSERRKSASNILEQKKPRALIDTQALKSPSFMVFTAAQFLVFAGYVVPLFYIPTFAQVSCGTTVSFSLWILVISQATSLVGRIVSSLLAQKIGNMIVWIGCTAACGVLCLAWLAIHETGAFIAFAALYGLFSSALVAVPPSIFPSLCPDPTKLGTWMGMSWGATAISFLIGSPIAGALTSEGDTKSSVDFKGVQIWSGVILLSATVFQAVTWALLRRKKFN